MAAGALGPGASGAHRVPVPIRLRPVGALLAVAVATAVALVGLLIGLSVAPRLQPSDTFQAKPRAVKQHVLGVDAAASPGLKAPPATPDRWWSGSGPYAVAVSSSPSPADRLGGVAVAAGGARAAAGVGGARGGRGPPV